jgi:hypothetical protein
VIAQVVFSLVLTLGLQPVEDPPGGVPLLPGAALVLVEDPGDPVEERARAYAPGFSGIWASTLKR